jgi:hypothetical protein
MTQPFLHSAPPPSVPVGSHRNRNAGIAAALVIGLLIGLVLGIFISPILLPTQTGAGSNNQVQVSGTVQETQTGTIGFSNSPETYRNSSVTPIQSTSFIANGRYSITLVGGHSYYVQVIYGYISKSYSLYVPLGVTTFTANF